MTALRARVSIGSDGTSRGAAFVVGLAASTVAATAAATHPSSLRITFAAALAVALLGLAAGWPRVAVPVVLLGLPLLALGRRLLIADAGWSSYDPLLLLAPAFALFLVVNGMLSGRRRAAGDRVERLVLALLVLAVLGAANPASGSLAAGVAGLLFIAAPLVWFFVGRDLLDRAGVLLIVRGFVVVATVVAAYGLWQSQVGFPSWDLDWVDLGGFASLDVYGVIRPFGTLSSANEYASVLGVGTVFAVVLGLHGRPLALLALPVLGTALVLSSARSPLLLATLAILVVVGLRTGRRGRAGVAIFAGLVLAAAGVMTYGARLDQQATQSDNRLLEHQVGGLANPLDPKRSTLILHTDIVAEGMKTSLRHPLGLGTAATNIASAKFGGGNAREAATEIDISDTFVGLGLAGGLVYLALVLRVSTTVVRRYLRERDVVVLAVCGLLFVLLGHWLTGGYYALAPLTWALIGWSTRPPGKARR